VTAARSVVSSTASALLVSILTLPTIVTIAASQGLGQESESERALVEREWNLVSTDFSRLSEAGVSIEVSRIDNPQDLTFRSPEIPVGDVVGKLGTGRTLSSPERDKILSILKDRTVYFFGLAVPGPFFPRYAFNFTSSGPRAVLFLVDKGGQVGRGRLITSGLGPEAEISLIFRRDSFDQLTALVEGGQ
jgi:hypothetical protein